MILTCKQAKDHATSSRHSKREGNRGLFHQAYCLLPWPHMFQCPEAVLSPTKATDAEVIEAPVVYETVPILTGNPGGNSSLMKSLSRAK